MELYHQVFRVSINFYSCGGLLENILVANEFYLCECEIDPTLIESWDLKRSFKRDYNPTLVRNGKVGISGGYK